MISDIIIYNVLWMGMTNTHKQRRLAGREEVLEGQEEYEELRVGSTMLASREDYNSLESLTEVRRRGCLYLLLMN